MENIRLKGRKGRISKNKLGFKGVSRQSENSFRAMVTFWFKDRNYYKVLGSFPTAQEAYDARCAYLDSLK